MKNIIVFYASYGGGHLSAANSIKQHIETNYPEYKIKTWEIWEVNWHRRQNDKVWQIHFQEREERTREKQWSKRIMDKNYSKLIQNVNPKIRETKQALSRKR